MATSKTHWKRKLRIRAKQLRGNKLDSHAKRRTGWSVATYITNKGTKLLKAIVGTKERKVIIAKYTKNRYIPPKNDLKANRKPNKVEL